MAKTETPNTQNGSFIVELVIRSKSPVLFDRMDPQTLLNMAGGIKTEKDTETSILDKAAKKLYISIFINRLHYF